MIDRVYELGIEIRSPHQATELGGRIRPSEPAVECSQVHLRTVK